MLSQFLTFVAARARFFFRTIPVNLNEGLLFYELFSHDVNKK